jgi:hypothetical protein
MTTKPEKYLRAFAAKLQGGEGRLNARTSNRAGPALSFYLELSFKREEGRDQCEKKNRRW